MFEIDGVPKSSAEEALNLASAKLPLTQNCRKIRGVLNMPSIRFQI